MTGILERDGFSPDLSERLPAPDGPRGLPWGLRLVLYMLSGLRIGSLEVRLPNGAVRHFTGVEPGPHGVWLIRSARLIRHLLMSGEVGIGDAYLDDCWDSPDLSRLLEVLHRNEPYYRGPFEINGPGRLYGWLRHRLRDNSRRLAKKNVEHHYDLGNEFYKLWLDDSLAYSGALYLRPNETLRDAQRNKFEAICERLDLRPEHRLLEIGSGWGGFAIYAATRARCRVHSITLSREQLAEARQRAERAGVADRVTFALCDYRDVDRRYDRVVSIEMYEAVGEAYWPAYFAAIARALQPGGRAAIQGITIDPKVFPNYRLKRDFIQKYIFPGGMLCPPDHFQALARDAGLQARDARFHAQDYADTLAAWHRNLLGARDRVAAQFGERFLRMWRYYLSYCECGFRTGTIDLMHLTLDKA